MAAAGAAGWASSLKLVSVTFSPVASAPRGVTAVREMLRQLRTAKAGASDKLVTNVQLRTSGDVQLTLQFASGKKIAVQPESLSMRDIRALIEDNA
ncbi:hypothetical protein KFE25_004324 [Diacronema lutheri]|uniref:Uncharacterized protein n=1 Tax=Diacronema lutheri TaxID=2081491 RepID=A0A8J5X4X8_DIALT|nr:hypothetical protein KFE25_004324 [Diacronema lutheri]